MTENFSEQKWTAFEASGKISDYLQYKGVNAKTFTDKSVQNTECKRAVTEIN
jgi:hypothetical protein